MLQLSFPEREKYICKTLKHFWQMQPHSLRYFLVPAIPAIYTLLCLAEPCDKYSAKPP